MNLLSRRFPTIIGVLFLLVAIAGGWWYLQNNKTKLSAPLELAPKKVKITNVADNKFSVSWVTQGQTTGEVEYGLVGESLSLKASDDRDSGQGQDYVTHHVTVKGLQPETQYAFRIISGGGNNRFDNNGSPYAVTTGPTIAGTPAAKSIYGEITGPAQTITDSIVYVALPEAAPASVLVNSSGGYSVPISIMRTTDLNKYIVYDPSATVANVVVEAGSASSTVTVTTGNSEPVPLITLGQDADYRTQSAQIAQVEPASQEQVVEPTDNNSGSSGFDVEPLAGSINLVGASGGVTLTNPASEGEVLATTNPEFRGLGVPDTVLSISVHSVSSYADTVVVGSDGTWSWTPPAGLEDGEHTITISYLDAEGIEQTITRLFSVSTALASEGNPSFVATPSASLSPSPSIAAQAGVSPTPTPTPTPREVIPSTESGVPVTGVITPTMLTATLGFVIMVLGAILLAI